MTTNTTNLLVADRILSTPFVVCAQVLHDGPITLRKRARRDHTQQTNGSCASLSLFKCILICIEIFPCRCMHTYKFCIYILYIHTFIWVWAFNPRRIGVLLMVSTIGVKVWLCEPGLPDWTPKCVHLFVICVCFGAPRSMSSMVRFMGTLCFPHGDCQGLLDAPVFGIVCSQASQTGHKGLPGHRRQISNRSISGHEHCVIHFVHGCALLQ